MTIISANIKVIIAEDHRMFADALEEIINKLQSMEVVAKVTNGKLLLQSLNSFAPDLILLDIQMPFLDGLQTAVEIRRRRPNIKIVLISSAYNKTIGNFIEKYNIDGFITKNVGAPMLIEAIRKIMDGDRSMVFPDQSTTFSDHGVNNQNSTSPDNLTKTEIEIIKLLVKGHSTKMIAQERGISPFTVETHRKYIFKKLNLKNVAEVVAYAFKQSLIDN